MRLLRQFLNLFFETKSENEAKKNSKDNKATPFHLFILVLAFGISLMLISHMFSSNKTNNKTSQTAFSQQTKTTNKQIAAFKSKNASTPDSMKAYEKDYESRLKDILDQVTGISNVAVMVNLATSERDIIQQDVNTQTNNTDETDQNNGQRKIDNTSRDSKTVLIGSGDNQRPVTVGKEKPKVEGVLVVAGGAENIKVKQWIVEAVSSVLDVPAYRVYVLPRKPKGE